MLYVSEPYVYINGFAFWIVNNFQPKDFKNSVAFNIQVFSETTQKQQC